MQYVEIDRDTGVVSWDAYFEYLSSARGDFPPELFAYAANREHYSPEGRNSLQGAWLIGIQLGYRAQDVVLAFLSAWHDRKHVLTYVGVQNYTLDIEVDYSAGNRDLVAHEFRAEDGLVTHELAFRNGRTLRVTCQDMIPATDMLS